MGFLDRLFGAPEPQNRRPVPPAPSRHVQRPMSDDELAVERYRYLLRTAPPQSIEAVHAEAFAKLTPQQRHLVYASLAAQLPPGEMGSEDPSSLARAATRAEVRQPGTLERTMSSIPAPGTAPGAAPGSPNAPGRAPGAPGFGSMFAGSMLGSVAGFVVGSAIVSAFLPDPGMLGGDVGAGDAGAGDAGGADASPDGGWSGGGGDFGGWSDGGGDFGGGDFGF